MTNQDKQTIWKWHRPECTIRDMRATIQGEPIGDTPIWAYCIDGHYVGWCPTLDMNFAFDVCMTRLKNESVSLVTIMYTPSTEGCGGNPYVCSIDCAADGAYDDVGATANEAFYSALLAYIKGVK